MTDSLVFENITLQVMPSMFLLTILVFDLYYIFSYLVL